MGRLVTNYEANWKKEGIELVKGLASFDDAQTVRVKLNAGGEQIIKASKVLVAVGGRPASPEDVPGIDLAINSVLKEMATVGRSTTLEKLPENRVTFDETAIKEPAPDGPASPLTP